MQISHGYLHIKKRLRGFIVQYMYNPRDLDRKTS